MTIKHKQSGFTLVELSIVLVIIGLIVGGVLSGRDMIRAAEIRSTISQMESFNTAVNTFRDKFGGVPGDIIASRAAQFGFTARSATGTETGAAASFVGQGDGNRLVEACDTGDVGFGCETLLFWRDLSDAEMVDDRYDTATDAYPAAAVTIADYLPTAKLGQGNFIHVYPRGGRNTFLMSGVTTNAAGGAMTLSQNLTPQTAFNIDDKLDDGTPLTGSILAVFDAAVATDDAAIAEITDADAAATPAGTAGASTDCAGGFPLAADEYAYNTSADGADIPNCQLSMKASF